MSPGGEGPGQKYFLNLQLSFTMDNKDDVGRRNIGDILYNKLILNVSLIALPKISNSITLLDKINLN